MELEVGIISWLLYFIVHSDTLSVFKKSSKNQSLKLELKVKFHHNLISIDNNSKLLSSVIAQALDELGEKIVLENQQAAIAIDDLMLSHSLSVIPKKDQLNLTVKIKEELQSKWQDLFWNYFSISENLQKIYFIQWEWTTIWEKKLSLISIILE